MILKQSMVEDEYSMILYKVPIIDERFFGDSRFVYVNYVLLTISSSTGCNIGSRTLGLKKVVCFL